MDYPVVFVLILVTITFSIAPAYSQEIYASENPIAAGSTVTLTSQANVTSGAWIFDNSIIVLIFPEGAQIFDPWTNRVTFNSTMSSLAIRSLQVEDSGLYTLQGVNFLAQLTLSVQVPVSNVTLTANAVNLVEFNDTAVLRCSASNGTSLTYIWLKNSSVVTASGGVQLSDGGATLTIVKVTHYDEGPYRCNVFNGISEEISPPLYLNISYGPSNTTMVIMPMRYAYKTGSNITLSCSAESNPPAMIQWMVNEVYLNQYGPHLQLKMATESNSGNYQCLLHNTVTSRFSSASAMIRIMEPIAAVVVNHTGGPAILDEPFTLHCEVTGPVESIQWWRNGQLISADNTTVLSMDNKTLVLNPVQHSDNGYYQCQAFNSVSKMISSPYTVEVNYGPMKPLITGPSMALIGSWESLYCSSNSYPPSHISWYFNDSLVANTEQLAIGSLTLNMSGKYICMAFNNVTGKNSTAYKMLTLLEPIAAVVVNHTGGPAILDESFTLHCEVTGPVESIQWWRNGQLIYADNTTVLSMDNKTLILSPVQHSDNGSYQCQAFNSVSNMTSSPYTVEVNYGPMKPLITGPSMALIGSWESLYCSSNSYPPSHISWYFNDSLVATTEQLAIGSLTLNMSGKYICMAFNNVTGKNSTAYKMLTLLAPVTMASIKIGRAQPIENHTFSLTCETAGSVESVIWMYGWSQLYPDNTTNFSINNATLTFDPVMKSDNGYYQCVASNALSSLTSESFMLDVFYGPEMPTIMGPNVALKGENITLSCHTSSNPLSSYKWFFNDSVVANTSEYVTPPLTIAMSGMYTCMAYNNVSGKNSAAHKMLTVLDPILHVQIETPMNPAIEGHFYKLTCNVTGPAEHVYWMKNGEPLHEDSRTVFYMDNKTVTFGQLEHNDTGDYQCMAMNAVLNMTSPPYMLIVNFGPETPIIDGPAYAETGRSAVFHCSAMSMPPSQFSWWFNGSKVANTSVFTTGPLSFNMSGEYRCMAHNYVTGKNSTYSKMLTVIAAIDSVMVRKNKVPISSENFTLTCEVTGPYDKIYWMKDNVNLSMNTSTAHANMSYHTENNTLHFTPVTKYNDGLYQCVTTNQAGPHTSPPYMLLVNYGPLNVYIAGPESVKVGYTVTLTCSADSRPDCDFYWFFSNHSEVLKTGSVLTFSAINENDGNYTCKARNPVTNITMYKTKAFTAHASALHIPSQGVVMLMGVFALSFTVLFN